MSNEILSPAEASELQSIPFEPAHEASLLSLHRRVFNEERSAEFLHWRRQGSDGKEAITQVLCTKRSGTVRAHFSIHPTRWNWLGGPILGGQVLDSMTDPAEPMSRYFRDNVDKCIARARDAGVQFMFGFPNGKGLPLMAKHHGCVPLLHLKQYYLNLGLPRVAPLANQPWLQRPADALVRLALRIRFLAKKWIYVRAIGGDFRIERGNAPPPGYDRFWNTMKARFLLCRWKDANYLRWRYRAPLYEPRDCRHYALYRNGSMVAYGVVVFRKQVAYLTELMAQDFDVPIARVLFYELVLDVLSSSARLLCFAGIDAGFFDRVLEDMRRRPAWDLLLMVRFLGNKTTIPVFHSLESWTISTGDTDLL